MADNDLNAKVEEAMDSVVTDLALSGVTVNTGGTAETLTTPYVICSCLGGGAEAENLKGTGVYVHAATVTVGSSMDDGTLATHRARVASVFDAFRDDAIAATLSSAVSGFHVYDVTFTGATQEEADRKLMNTLEMEIVCCASDIS